MPEFANLIWSAEDRFAKVPPPNCGKKDFSSQKPGTSIFKPQAVAYTLTRCHYADIYVRFDWVTRGSESENPASPENACQAQKPRIRQL
jgi:hypothetical protein